MTATTNRRTVLVTGGSRGIGAAIVRRFAADGARVTFSYRSDRSSAEALVADLDDGTGRVTAVQADATDRADARHLAATASDGGRLDVAVSNAGVEHFGALADITEEDVRRVYGTNVAGQLWTAQASADHMAEGGRIVLTSSVSARMGVFDHALYAGSKAAVSAMVANLAHELGRRRITINAIAPGGTATDMAAEHAARYNHPDLAGVDLGADRLAGLHTAAGRLAQPEEVAAGVVWLASPEASYVSGSTLAIDGGLM